ncbi:VWA domain-containing protein, partial [Streptomyces sp. NPDC057411]
DVAVATGERDETGADADGADADGADADVKADAGADDDAVTAGADDDAAEAALDADEAAGEAEAAQDADGAAADAETAVDAPATEVDAPAAEPQAEAEAQAAAAAESPADAPQVEEPEAEVAPAADAEVPAQAEAPARGEDLAEAEPQAEPQATADAEPRADAPEAEVAPAPDAEAPADAEVAPAPDAEAPAHAEVAHAADAEVPAEADVVALADGPQDDAAAPAVEADAEGGEQAAVAAPAAPALSLAKLKAAAPHLADAYKAAGAVLKKQGLAGARAAVYLVVDRSGSMRPYFKDGSVQRLAEQTVALAAHLSEDATVTAVFFSTDIDGTAELRPADLAPDRIETLNATLGRMGRTNYHRAVEEVLAHHEKNDPTRPALVVFQTDGAPESKTAATQALAEAADRPVHWRFTAWGDEDNKAFDYLRKLSAPKTGVHLAGPAPLETPHAAFYRGLLADA